MGSSTGNGEAVSEQARSDKPFPITEIRTSQATPKPATAFLRFLSYGLPWAAWLLNVALLITPRYQKADISLCLGGDFLQEQLVATGNTNATTLPSLCEYRAYHLGIVRSTEELTGASALSAEDDINDLAADDFFNSFALGASSVPVTLGCILMCICCGPVLLGEFAKGQSMLWNISFLVHFISALFSALTMLFLQTDMCQEDQICTTLQENDRYSAMTSSILGFNGAIAALNDGDSDPINVECQQTCSVDAGFYLSIVTTVLWLSAFGGTVMLKKANAKIHP
ncbi:unnamed protein product [Cylindrotheca closterium]|uniref:Uncharacterized protein n=1 Tax=Cylindrotheca closterium TaxID=2856 RepID=A0AAD2CQE0_9STRA|nr:unnamed protein product [Cylindrotheca closterium]